MNTIFFKLFIGLHRLVKGLANRVLDKQEVRPRNFSNKILRQYAGLFKGSVINVSGWQDDDGEGGKYRDYFSQCQDYVVSNVSGQYKGFGSTDKTYKEIELDLSQPLPLELEGQFDVVFNHTTLEHILDFQTAFRNLCRLSKEAVIIVVPVMQQIHNAKDFGDYWRPTTMTIATLFRQEGYTPVVLRCNDQPFAPIYCFALGVKNRESYLDIQEDIDFEMGRYNYGSSLKKESLSKLLK